MLYPLLRAVAHEALHWYYAGVVVQGAERIPVKGPLVIAANHPNALVDALVVTTTVRRRVLLTAKATLFERPLMARLLRAIGVVPLRRVADERAAARDGRPSSSRNTDAFNLVSDALISGNAVLIFPEGISHDAPALAPLKTGAARMALAARDAGARGLCVVPMGLVFEEKERPRSRVLVRVGEPIDIDAWSARAGGVAELTAEIDTALRQVTLNFASEARARRAVQMAAALAAIVDAPPSLDHARPLASEAELARRIERATDALSVAPPDIVRQADALVSRVSALQTHLAARHVALADLQISPRLHDGLRFVLREGAVTVAALPAAILGRLAHWIPLRLARAAALRSLRRDPSRDQPAMRTMLLGVALVVCWYLSIGALLMTRFGLAATVLGLALLVSCARVDFLLRDRTRRAYQRARTYLALRGDPVLRAEALEEIRSLRDEAAALDAALTRASVTA